MSRVTQLRHALRSCHWEEAERLYEQSPGIVEMLDSNGHGIAEYAAMDGRWDELRWLMSRGAPWEQALIGICVHGDAPKVVLDEILGVVSQDDGMDSKLAADAIVSAIVSRASELVTTLLSFGWPISQDGWGCIWKAAIKSFDPAQCELLLARDEVSFAIHRIELGACAVQLRQLPALGWLFKEGLDLDAIDSGGMSLLGRAAKSRQPEVTKWLIAAGAAVDLVDAFGHTSLYYAVASGDVGSAEALIFAGADPEFRQGLRGQGDSPIRLAAKSGARSIRSELLRVMQASVLRNFSGGIPVATSDRRRL